MRVIQLLVVQELLDQGDLEVKEDGLLVVGVEPLVLRHQQHLLWDHKEEEDLRVHLGLLLLRVVVQEDKVEMIITPLSLVECLIPLKDPDFLVRQEQVVVEEERGLLLVSLIQVLGDQERL